MKKTILLAVFTAVLMSTKSCSYDPTGTEAAFIYPKENIANVYEVTERCPIKVSPATTVPLSDLEGWICTRPSKVQEIRREFNSTCK